MLNDMIQTILRQQQYLADTSLSEKGMGRVSESKKTGSGENDDTREEFWERMIRIQREKEERQRIQDNRKMLRKKRQEEYERQLALRELRRQALNKQYIFKKIEDRQLQEDRGEKLIMARSHDGRLPLTGQEETPRVIRVKVRQNA